MWVKVYEENFFIRGERSGEVISDGGFTAAAFLVDDCYGFHTVFPYVVSGVFFKFIGNNRKSRLNRIFFNFELKLKKWYNMNLIVGYFQLFK